MGTEEIGSMFEKKEYTTYQYVSLFPNGSISKNYKVVSEIWATDKNYVIQKAYFPNGGFIRFKDFIFELPYDSLKFNEEVRITDDNGTVWKIMLLNEKPNQNLINSLIK